MFDSHHIKAGPNYPQHVHHHQPTTPDQLRNLRETEEKIRSQIVSTHNFNNELANGRVTTFYDPEFEQHTILISFRINGCEREVRKTVCDRDFQLSPVEAFHMLAESIAVEITKIMLEPMDREINNRRGSLGI